MIPRPEDVRQAIRSSFLSVLAPDQTERLLARSIVVDIPPGQLIIDEDAGSTCGILMRGIAREYLATRMGGEVTVRRAGVGSGFGLVAIDGGTAAPLVRAVTACRFLCLDGNALNSLARSDASVACAVKEEVSRRLRDTYVEFSNAVTGSVRQRVARLLIDLGVAVAAEQVVVRASQFSLAAMLGVARESVGHELRYLAAVGLIEQQRGQIVISDLAGIDLVANDYTPARERPQAATLPRGLMVVGGRDEAAGPTLPEVTVAGTP